MREDTYEQPTHYLGGCLDGQWRRLARRAESSRRRATPPTELPRPSRSGIYRAARRRACASTPRRDAHIDRSRRIDTPAARGTSFRARDAHRASDNSATTAQARATAFAARSFGAFAARLGAAAYRVFTRALRGQQKEATQMERGVSGCERATHTQQVHYSARPLARTRYLSGRAVALGPRRSDSQGERGGES